MFRVPYGLRDPHLSALVTPQSLVAGRFNQLLGPVFESHVRRVCVVRFSSVFKHLNSEQNRLCGFEVGTT